MFDTTSLRHLCRPEAEVLADSYRLTRLVQQGMMAADEIDRLRTALRTVLGDADHGQNMTWEERCRIGRAALE